MERVFAVLLDTVSIQKYIFSSNSLKENLGASFLVESIFRDFLSESIHKTTGEEIDLNRWCEQPELIEMSLDEEKQCEVGYIGGGNALLFFRNREHAQDFIKNWTSRLIVDVPGIQTAVAIEPFSLDPNEYKAAMQNLVQSLERCKNSSFPNTVLPKHGITADCPFSGYSMDVLSVDPEQGQVYMSSVSKAKREAADAAGQKAESDYFDILDNKYTFTNRIDYLGQREGDSHLAIVHIDGNGMGKRFSSCRDLTATRKLSKEVEIVNQNAFRKLLTGLVGSMETYFANNDLFFLRKDKNDRIILPIRPIVLGGDDITFVTDGRLGVYLAQKYISYLIQDPVGEDGIPISACAGVAITKTRYPFYRGYRLAEELCSSAKKEARKVEGSSWLDFYISQGGFSGSLDGIRTKHYQVPAGSLHFGPYSLDHNDSDEEKAFFNLVQGMKHFGTWPRNKLKELREILVLGPDTCQSYIQDLKARDLLLPKITGPVEYQINGWENSRTPYFEMLEFMEFYPEEDFLS